MPGDDLVPSPQLSTTRAVTIDAPRTQVWRWLAQLGVGRAGLYSYDALENALLGYGIRSSDEIVPELQQLSVGDAIALAPGGAMSLEAVQVEPPDHLVLLARVEGGSGRLLGPGETTGREAFAVSWAWSLREAGTERTRLVARFRLRWTPGPLNWLMWRGMTEPAHFVMERKMLLGIRERAERAWRQAVPA